MPGEKAEKPEEKTGKLEDDSEDDVDFLEDDDEFEEFPADPVEDQGRISIVEPNNPQRKAQDWDDEDVDVDFDEILCKEIGLKGMSNMMIDLGSQFPSLSLATEDEYMMEKPEMEPLQELDLTSPKRKLNKENSPDRTSRSYSPTKRRSSSIKQKSTPISRPSSTTNKNN